MNIFKNLKNLTYQEKPVSLELSPFECFKRIYAQSENCFFLESLGDEDLYSRFAYIGCDPVLTIKSDTCSYAEIANLSKISITNAPKKGFAGGLVGYFGYGAACFFDPAFKVKTNPNFPDFELGLYMDGLIFDRIGKRESYFTCGENRLDYIQKLLQKPAKLNPFQSHLIKTSKSKPVIEFSSPCPLKITNWGFSFSINLVRFCLVVSRSLN